MFFYSVSNGAYYENCSPRFTLFKYVVEIIITNEMWKGQLHVIEHMVVPLGHRFEFFKRIICFNDFYVFNVFIAMNS